LVIDALRPKPNPSNGFVFNFITGTVEPMVSNQSARPT
jgi:hypothetical protein